MKKYPIILAAGLMMVSSACSDKADDEPVVPVICPTIEQNGHLEELDHVSFDSQQAVANEAVNRFSFKFFNAVAADWDKDGNVAESNSASPVSAAIFLGMLANSAEGDTRAQIVDALGYENIDALNGVCNQLLRYLPNKKNGAEMSLANSVWFSDNLPVAPAYAGLMADVFGATVRSVDFGTPSGAIAINQWADKATNGLIKSLFEAKPLNVEMFLANALYFNGQWEQKFDKSQTKSQVFHGTKGDATAQMMNQELVTRYADNGTFEIVDLSFAGAYRMCLLLPRAGVDIAEASQALTYEQWRSLREATKLADVTLHLPKFKTESRFNLNAPLGSLGIDLDLVNLSPTGINNSLPMYSFQVTISEVDEDGAQLAAVTGGYANSVQLPELFDIDMAFDRPFLYVVENTATGSIIMAGRVANI